MADAPAAADLVAALNGLTEVEKTGKASIPGRPPYSYMQLPDLMRAVRTTFAAHHIAVMQQLRCDGTAVTVTTVLVHASGTEWASDPLSINTRGAAQDIGSAATYARRYSLAAMVGLAGDDDDDGQSARPAPPTRPAAMDTPTPVPPPRDHTRGSITPGTATPKSVKAMWSMLTDTNMNETQVRGWVAALLGIAPDWSTKDLSQYQVSMIIDRLKQEEQQTLDGEGGD